MNTEPAKRSAARFLESHFRGKACDHEAVSECLRCNALYLANETLKPQASNEAHGWRPIETAPRDGTEIIALIGPKRPTKRIGLAWWMDRYGWLDVDGQKIEPIGWVTMPQAIAGDGEGGQG